MKKTFVLFVCTGNICRSPMAAALFRARASAQGDQDRWRVESAGTWGVDGQPASAHAGTVMQERGINLENHLARTVTAELLQTADIIIVMTRSHRDALSAEFSGVRPKIHLMSTLNDFEYDVIDPYGKPIEAYRECADTLEQLIARGYDRVSQWAYSKAASVENS